MVVASAAPRCHMVVAQAPSACEGTEAALQEVRDFWREVGAVLAKQGASQVLLMADANAEMGSMVSDVVGDVHAAQETPAGDIFHTWLLRWGVALPATFVEQEGDGCTWSAPSGCTRKRLDYVGVPISWLPAVASARVDDNIDLSITRPDHATARVSLRGIRARGSGMKTRAKPYDLRRLHEPEVAERFRAYLRETPIPPWSMDPDRHAASLAESVECALAQACPRRKIRPRQSWVSDLAAHVSASRARLLRAVGKAHRELTPNTSRLAYILASAAEAVQGAIMVAQDALTTRDWRRQPGLRDELADLTKYSPAHSVDVQVSSASPGATWREAARGLIGALAGQGLALHRALGRAARRVLAQDRNEYVLSRAGAVCHLMAQGRQREAYQAIRAIRACSKGSRRQRTRAAPQLQMEDGSLAQSASQAAERWLHYFGDMERSDYCQPAALVGRLLEEQSTPISDRAPFLNEADLTCNALLPWPRRQWSWRASISASSSRWACASPSRSFSRAAGRCPCGRAGARRPCARARGRSCCPARSARLGTGG